MLSQFFSSTRGGGENLFHLMAHKLAENDHQVWVITNRIESEDYLYHKNIKIIFVPPVLKYKGGLPSSFKDNFLYLINSIRVGFGIVHQNKIEIIHSNNFTPAFAGSFLSFWTSTIHITSVWDIFSMCGCDYWKKWVKQSGVSKINQFIGPIFEKLVMKIKSDAFHTISNASKEDLITFGAKKPIFVIPPSIKKIEGKQQTIKNNQFICVGRLVFYKNIEILIKAIQIAKNEIKDIKLIIVGGGPQIKIIENMIDEYNLQKHILVKGYVDTLEKIKLISESNALLFPSLCEGFGLVILEAFSQNKSVFVSDIRPMSDIIIHGKTGFVLNPKDENLWAEYLVKLVRNPEKAKLMGSKGYETLNSSYSHDSLYGNLIKMYTNVLSKK